MMNGPITNFELGKMQHREYEAEASRYWGQGAPHSEQRTLSRKHKLVLALSGTVVAISLIVQMQVF
jgi:hypothetical protein